MTSRIRFFTADNSSDEYTATDLAALNAALNGVLIDYYPAINYAEALDVQDMTALNTVDHLAERVKAAYDDGHRGVDLINLVGEG